MMNIHVANQSPFRVRFPEANNRADNIDLAKKYLAQEQSLPAKKQICSPPSSTTCCNKSLTVKRRSPKVKRNEP